MEYGTMGGDLTTALEDLGGGRLRVAPAGPLDKSGYAAFSALAEECLARPGVAGLWFDLSGVTALSAAGAGVFIGLLPKAAERGTKVVVYGLPAGLMAKAGLFGLPALTTLYVDRAAAEAAEG